MSNAAHAITEPAPALSIREAIAFAHTQHVACACGEIVPLQLFATPVIAAAERFAMQCREFEIETNLHGCDWTEQRCKVEEAAVDLSKALDFEEEMPIETFYDIEAACARASMILGHAVNVPDGWG